MELVPILSTIILVGTIATFILAVAAYVLYKIRERRALQEGDVQRQAAPDPHVLVAPQQPQMIGAPQQQQPQWQQQQPQWQQQPQTNVYVDSPQGSQGRQGAYGAQEESDFEQEQATPVPSKVPQVGQPSQQNSLFWEYTDEGFVPVRPDDPSKEDEQKQSQQGQDDGFAWL